MRTKTGIIVSNKMKNTIVINVTSYKTHPKYKKKYQVSKKFYAHCEDETKFNIGDTVTIEESIPISKLKRWKVTKAQ